MAGEEPDSSSGGLLDGAWTVPNLVTLVRLLAIPYFWWVLLARDAVGLAALLIFLIGSTDWVDGYLARRLGQVSRLGTLIDPIADRAMIASAIIGGLIAGVLPVVIAAPLIVRELMVTSGVALLAARGGGNIAVRSLGKVSTFLLYGAIPSFYLAAADILPTLFAPAAWIAGALGIALYWWVAFEYLRDIRLRLHTAALP